MATGIGMTTGMQMATAVIFARKWTMVVALMGAMASGGQDLDHAVVATMMAMVVAIASGGSSGGNGE